MPKSQTTISLRGQAPQVNEYPPAMASSSPGARPWRTAFLTLRDETLTSPPPPAILALLRRHVLSQPHDALAAAAASLPSPEVTSDVMFLVDLASGSSVCNDALEPLLQICHLIHDICCRVRLELSSSSWTAVLDFIELVLEHVYGNANKKSNLSSTSRLKAMSEILEVLRLFVKVYGRISLLSETKHLVKVLIFIISYLHSEMLSANNTNDTPWYASDNGSTMPKISSLCEMQIITLSLLDDALSKNGPSISESLWNSVVEVLRKVMDFLASKNLVIFDSVMSRFYASLFHCLHLILLDPKGSLSGHVAGFVTTLQMFFTYGLPSRSSLASTSVESKNKGIHSAHQKSGMLESEKSERVPYRPPHLRRREESNMYLPGVESSSDCKSSRFTLFSSDSEHSDNDVTATDVDRYRSSKARLAAILCIQDLCNAEPKSIISLWTLLLPENDVLQPRKYQQTLMSCLLFDPVMKIRIASVLTLAAMLDGHSVVFLQVAEHRESTKCGSFTTLSSSLGQILVQLHTGILYLIKRECHDGLLASLFKVLLLLISATPYSRMPEDLLSATIASVHDRIKRDLEFKTENIGILGTALNCLGAALSKSPPSAHVLKMLEEDISRGFVSSQQNASALNLLIQLSELGRHPAITFESLQVLKVVSHNYPSLMTGLWDQISAIAYRLLQTPVTPEVSKGNAGSCKADSGKVLGTTTERCTMAAIKVIDECLRGASGFKGADDLLEFRLLDIQLMTNNTRVKKVSSAPSYELDIQPNKNLTDFSSAVNRWSEVIEKYLPLAIYHCAPMVRAAALTCFAGLTSSVFSILNEDIQEFVISSAITAAFTDEAPSVKSAACRSIGVLSSFPQNIFNGSVLNKFIGAAEFNSRDPTSLVRVTASWALANICDSLRHKATELQLEFYTEDSGEFDPISLLVETALRLTKDGDKIKSNAVRALGYISRFLIFNCDSTANGLIKNPKDSCHAAQSLEFSRINICQANNRMPLFTTCDFERTKHGDPQWLERMVQAFLSCVTTGNVKVQWNVCHALSNLFMNDSLSLHDMQWAPTVYSILLLLLRDSTNYKIRIHAAVALAVPSSRLDYGGSFPDVVQGLEHVLESVGSHQPLMPSSFKYKDNLEKQVILTTLHVLGFVTLEDGPTLKDFLLKKAHFFEGWFKFLCSSLTENQDPTSTSMGTSTGHHAGGSAPFVPKKSMVQTALKSLYDIYNCSNHHVIAERFEKLINNYS